MIDRSATARSGREGDHLTVEIPEDPTGEEIYLAILLSMDDPEPWEVEDRLGSAIHVAQSGGVLND